MINNLNAPKGVMIDQDGNPLPVWYQWFALVGNVLVAMTASGTTANRPLKFLWVGRNYFNTTLGQMEWYNGTAWVTYGAGGGAPTNASYLVLGLDGTLTNERVLTAGTNVTFVDTGANGTLTVNASGGGAAGAQGAIGMMGEDGADGDIGPPGIAGARGGDGRDGPPGDDGLEGDQGIPGAQGIQGIPGLALIGPPGDDGADGDNGPPGPAGPRGIQGPVGPVAVTVFMGQAQIDIGVRRKKAGSTLIEPKGGFLASQVGKPVTIHEAGGTDEAEHVQLLCTAQIITTTKMKVTWLAVGGNGYAAGKRTINYLIAA